jgi:hypothetical protein
MKLIVSGEARLAEEVADAASQIERSSLCELERQPTMLFSPASWNAPNNDPFRLGMSE